MRGRPFTLPGARAACRLVAGAVVSATLLAGVAGCGGGDANVYTVRAIFDSASFITSGLDVKIAGVAVGKVTGVDLTDDNRAAVTFTITSPGFADMRQDAHCTIRPQALIGERYIECTLTEQRPDGATAPAALATIPSGQYKGEHLLRVENTDVPVDSDQVLDVNNASVRERFGIIIRELGAGVAGRGDEIATTLAKGNEGLRYANVILRRLSDQQEMLKQLTSSTDATLASLASQRSSLSSGVENAATVASRLATRKNELKGTITSLNQLLTEVQPTATRVTDLTDQLKPIADDLNRSSTDLATVLNLLPDVATNGSTAVKALAPVVDQGRTILTSDTNNALIDRLVNTASAVKTTGSLLGLTLGDFRATGGLDYFLDAIYGLAYSTNGRDATGSYLRGAVLNVLGCALPNQVQPSGCGTSRLPVEGDGLKATPKSSSASSASVVATPTPAPSADATAAKLLLGGQQ